MIIYVLWPEGFLVRSKNSFGQNDETQTPQIPTVVERVSDFRSKLFSILIIPDVNWYMDSCTSKYLAEFENV